VKIELLYADPKVAVQAADFLFGAAAQPHDFLHEPLFRIFSTGLLSAGAASLALRVSQNAFWAVKMSCSCVMVLSAYYLQILFARCIILS